MTTFKNPFRIWTGLLRGLHNRFLSELGKPAEPPSIYTGEILGALAALATDSNRLAGLLERYQERDPKAFDAFVRALERE